MTDQTNPQDQSPTQKLMDLVAQMSNLADQEEAVTEQYNVTADAAIEEYEALSDEE